MKPTRLVITIPIVGWSKHDSVDRFCKVVALQVKRFLEIIEKTYGASPLDTNNMRVHMETDVTEAVREELETLPGTDPPPPPPPREAPAKKRPFPG